MLNVVVLNVANKPFMLSVIMLNVIMLSLVMLNAVALKCTALAYYSTAVSYARKTFLLVPTTPRM